MSLPVAPIPWRFWPTLAVCVGGFGWMFWHALRRPRKRNKP